MGCDGSKDATADRRRQPAPGGGRQQGAGQQQGRPQGTAANVYPIQQQRPVQGQLVQPSYPQSQLNVASRPVCQYFMQGNCRTGASCPYLHPMYISAPAQQMGPNPPVARPVCANFLAGSCPAGPGCPYAHVAPAQYGQSRQPMPNPLPYGYGASPPQSVPYRNGAPIAPLPQSQRQQPQQPGQGQGSREDEEALQAALAASVTDHREDEDRRQLAAALAASAAAAEREAVEISLIEEQRRRDQQRRSAEPPAHSVAGRPVEPQSPPPGPPAAVDIRNQDPLRVFAVFPYAAPKDCSTETADDKSCAICFDDYVPGVLVMALPCLHRFHAACARDWIAKQPVCPACNCDVYNTGSLTLRA